MWDNSIVLGRAKKPTVSFIINKFDNKNIGKESGFSSLILNSHRKNLRHNSNDSKEISTNSFSNYKLDLTDIK